MAYIGRDLQYGVLDKQSFTADSSTTVFTLDTAVANAKSLLVSVGGVIQEPDVAYTASGTTLTFTSAPTTGDVVYVIYLGKELSVSGASREGITYQTGTGDDTTTPITLTTAPANAQSIMVMLNGVTQVPVTDYTVSGTTLTFTSTVASGVGILVYYLANQAEFGVLNDNSVTNPKIVSMDAAKLTGSLPAGMGTDTTEIDQTIASLGMHVAVADNKASFNLPGVFIDQFESDSGILTETDVDRDTTGEYVSSGTSNTDFGVTFSGSGTGTNGLRFPGAAGMVFSGDVTFSWWQKTTNPQTADTTGVFGTTDQVNWLNNGAVGYHIGYSANSGTPSLTYGRGTGNNSVAFSLPSSGHDGNWHHMAITRQGTTWRAYMDGVASVTTFTDSGTLGHASYDVIIGAQEPTGTQNFIGTIDSFCISGSNLYPNGTTFTPPTTQVNGTNFTHHFDASTPGHDPNTPDYRCGNGTATIIGNVSAYGTVDGRYATTLSATGTLISTASTADTATTTASGVMVYENASGTATLGTDLKIYFSADDGANWTEASSYGTGINFNGASKKLIKLGKTTGLTSGTQMKLKAEWANQASGTKETRLYGWAINY